MYNPLGSPATYRLNSVAICMFANWDQTWVRRVQLLQPVVFQDSLVCVRLNHFSAIFAASVQAVCHLSSAPLCILLGYHRDAIFGQSAPLSGTCLWCLFNIAQEGLQLCCRDRCCEKGCVRRSRASKAVDGVGATCGAEIGVPWGQATKCPAAA